MANTKHEDAIMKMGFDYFRDTILKLFGIEYNYIDTGPTELIELQIHNLYMDFTFLTTKNIYIHIEFQTTDSGIPDLRRFSAYEAVFRNKTGKNVITYVIYSGGIKDAQTELDCGLYTYRIQPIYMSDKNADTVFQRLKQKQMDNTAFTDEDFAQLALSPLMTSSLNRKDTMKEALLLIKPYHYLPSAQKSLSMLYALADKFLKGSDLNDIKEVIAMTRIGQMLYDEGIEKGVERGTTQMCLLTQNLLRDHRLEDLEKAAENDEYRKKLMEEYGI